MYNNFVIVLLIVAFMGLYSYRTAETTRAALQTKVLAPQLLVLHVISTAIYASSQSATHIILSYYDAVLNEVRQRLHRSTKKSKIIGKKSCRGP